MGQKRGGGRWAFSSFSCLGSRSRVTGRQSDSETGLYYYRARYYDPGLGRFLSGDPTGFDGGLNFYRYVANDPVDTSDPSGLQSKKRKRRAQPNAPPCDAVFPKDPTTARLAQLTFAEGNGTSVGDLAIASVVVNRANYGNPGEFGNGILGVINKGFQGTGDPLFNRVSSQAKVCTLNHDNCQRYKNAALAAAAAQTVDGTNTDALFFYDNTIAMPPYLAKGIAAGYIVPVPVDGGPSQISGIYGGSQYFYGYTNFNH